MVNEAEFAALQAAKKAKKAAASEKKLERDAKRNKRKQGEEGGEAEAPAAAAEAASAGDYYDSRAEPAASSAPTSALPAPPSTAGLVDKTISCVDCGNDFIFSVGEQQFFLSNGYASGKSRCKECTRAKKARFGEAADGAARRAATTTCYACGKVGHSSKDCKVKPLSCFNCGGTGHKSRDCPQPRDNSAGGGVCFKFQSGSCTRGDACRFAHILEAKA